MSFNIDELLSTDIKGAHETEYQPVPEGEWRAQIVDLSGRQTEKGYNIVDVRWQIDDEECMRAMGRDEPVPVRQSIFLDLDEEGHPAIGTDKNVQLGRLRSAVGQNDPKKAWNFQMLVGQQARVIVRHRAMDDGSIRANVIGAAELT